MENIELGLLLMVVGMVTVFVILLIVIWLSQLLISIVNKAYEFHVFPAIHSILLLLHLSYY